MNAAFDLGVALKVLVPCEDAWRWTWRDSAESCFLKDKSKHSVCSTSTRGAKSRGSRPAKEEWPWQAPWEFSRDHKNTVPYRQRLAGRGQLKSSFRTCTGCMEVTSCWKTLEPSLQGDDTVSPLPSVPVSAFRLKHQACQSPWSNDWKWRNDEE